MNIYKINDIGELIKDNSYVGRGIVIGKTADGSKAVSAYFIMGRSNNSRNRVFTEKNGEVFTEPFDASKVEDPSLIIYAALRTYKNSLIVTNGNQTDTIYEGLEKGLDFKASLEQREFEPDAPNFTPRISGIMNFADDDFTYKMSILKSADAEGTACNRYFYEYAPINGLGHFIHTYVCDGNPVPTFQGEPERVEIADDIDAFAEEIWNSTKHRDTHTQYYRDTPEGKAEFAIEHILGDFQEFEVNSGHIFLDL